MRDRTNPYFIIERDGGGSGVGPFLLGALLGAGVALLFAPRSGEETQAEIRERAIRLRDAAEERLREAQAQIEERLEQAREELMERVEAVKEAVESGKDFRPGGPGRAGGEDRALQGGLPGRGGCGPGGREGGGRGLPPPPGRGKRDRREGEEKEWGAGGDTPGPPPPLLGEARAFLREFGGAWAE
jgi:hypothetical protein